MAENGKAGKAGGALTVTMKPDSEDEGESMDVPEHSRASKERQEQILQEFEMRRKIQATIVPTDAGQVRQMLRQLGEPVTLFGEREMERRERLRRLVAERDIPLESALGESGQELVYAVSTSQREHFYTEGTKELREARQKIALWSVKRAQLRIQNAKNRREAGGEEKEREIAQRAAAQRWASTMSSQSSEFADDRVVSCCAFSPDSAAVLTAGWSGLAKIWGVPDSNLVHAFRAHEERCTGVTWHPFAQVKEKTDAVALATGSADKTAKLWTGHGKMLLQLAGHTDRLGRIAFHPMGRHLATASFDATWRLWDVETGTCLLEQEGHSRAIYAVAFQCDGALVASGGLDAIGRVWDCRSGRSILTLQGHVKEVLSADFSPNGYILATGSGDHTCRVWDLRKKDCVHTIAAHSNLLSQVKFEPNENLFLLTASYDGLAQMWNTKDYSQLAVLLGHEGKVMAADVCADGSSRVATVGFDRTLKYWAPDADGGFLNSADALNGSPMNE